MKKKLCLICLCVIILFSLCIYINQKQETISEDPAMVEKYNEALSLMNKDTNTIHGEYNKYIDAKKIFEKLGEFRDSKAKIEECYTKVIPSTLQIAEQNINEGDIWGAKFILTYPFGNPPNEIKEYLEKDIFYLIGDWKFESKGTYLRVDLSSQMGHLDIFAQDGSTYNTVYWKIKNNKLYFCDITNDEDDDSNYKEVFTIVSYNQNTLIIKNSQQSFTLTK